MSHRFTDLRVAENRHGQSPRAARRPAQFARRTSQRDLVLASLLRVPDRASEVAPGAFNGA